MLTTADSPLRVAPLAEARRREIERRARLRRLASLRAGDDLPWRLARIEQRHAVRVKDLPPGASRDYLAALAEGRPQRRRLGVVVGVW